MSTSILELIEGGAFDLTKLEDAKWLIGQQKQFEALVEKAEADIEAYEEAESAEAERQYREKFPEDEE